MDPANESPLVKAFFATVILATVFGFVFVGKQFGEQPVTYIKDEWEQGQVAAVSDSTLDAVWCRLSSWVGFSCEPVSLAVEKVTDNASETPVIPPRSLEVIGTSETSTTTTTVVQYVTNEYVTNEYVTNPIERETVREVVINNGTVDTSRFITREEYDRQIDALLTSIERVSRVSSGSDTSGLSDITGESLEDLEDVGSMSQVSGDLLTWNGTAWINIATSSLGFVSGAGLAELNGETSDSQSFATSTSGGLNLHITSAGGVHTFTSSLASGYSIPLTASTTEWAIIRNLVTASSSEWGSAYTLSNLLNASSTVLSNQINALNASSSILFASTTNLTTLANLLNSASSSWNAAAASTTALTPAYIRGLFSNTATGLSYNSSTGVTSLTGGYTIPLSASTTEWGSAYTLANLLNSASSSWNAAAASTTALTPSYIRGLFSGSSPVSYNSSTGAIGITADSVGDTQLAFNTGQHLTTTSNPTFANLTLTNASTTNLTVSTNSYFASHLRLTGTSSNIILGSNYISGDGDDEGIYIAPLDGYVSIGSGTSPSYRLDVSGHARVTDVLRIGSPGSEDPAPNAQVGIALHNSGRVSANVNGGESGKFGRTGSDGNIIGLYSGGTLQGAISVSGSTVSYGAFTGAHYVTMESPIERGLLVSLSGPNQYAHGRDSGEPIYSVSINTVENAPSVLGSMLALQEPTKEHTLENPYLIQAVGNGEMWVVQGEESLLQPGDYLVSSEIPGYAKKDSGKYPISHIIGKVTDSVDWGNVSNEVNGRKRAYISVTFEQFAYANPVEQLKDKTEIGYFAALTKRLVDWFADSTNGIGTMMASVFKAKNMICVDNECLTADDIRKLKEKSNIESEPDDDFEDEDVESNTGDGDDEGDDTNPSPAIVGCTDPGALNYDLTATEDEGCLYEDEKASEVLETGDFIDDDAVQEPDPADIPPSEPVSS